MTTTNEQLAVLFIVKAQPVFGKNEEREKRKNSWILKDFCTQYRINRRLIKKTKSCLCLADSGKSAAGIQFVNRLKWR